jgi:methyltransferase (TIGR00027 family)
MRTGGPTVTARWVAAQRLRLERTRPSTPGGDVDAEHRLLHDVAGGLPVPAGRSSVLAQRTRVIDAEVARTLGRGTTQIVLLGAGYDGRSLRFGGGAARWFEVDRPATLTDKKRRLDALGIAVTGATYLGLDLQLQHADLAAALETSGHDATAPSLFVCEGLFDSLTLEATAALCETLHARAAPGSVLVATCTVAPDTGAPGRVLRAAGGLLRAAADERRRNEFRPGDVQKLLVVTGWRVQHAEVSPERRIDPGAHALVVVCEPDPAQPT